MSRLALLFATLLICAPLAAADYVTAELPASDLRLVPAPYTSCSVVSGATKAYAFCTPYGGGLTYRYDLAPDGAPIFGSRLAVAPTARAVAAGDAFFYTAIIGNAAVVRRFGSDAEVRFETAAQPTLVWNGGGLLLLLYTSNGTVTGAIVDTELHVVVQPFAIMPNPAGAWPTAASAGGGFMVILYNNRSVSGAIVNSIGGVHPVALPAPQASFQALTSNGSEYLYLWQLDRTPLVAQRYSPLGVAVGDLEVVAQSGTGNLSFPGAVWTGSNYLIEWQDSDDAWMCTLGGAPQRLGKGLAQLSAGPAGVFLILTWVDTPPAIRRLDINGPDYVLAAHEPQQLIASMAIDGLDAAVVWTEDEVRFGRVNADGTRRDGPGVVLPIPSVSTAMAFDGKNYLIVWMANQHVNGLFVGRDGRVAGLPFIIANEKNESQRPGITWTGTVYLVTWASSLFGLGAGATVTPAGDATTFMFSGSGFGSSASAGPRTLVVTAGSEFAYEKISGVFLDAAGSPFDIARELLTGGFFSFIDPRVVSNGRDYLVTWTRRSQPPHGEAWMARIDDHGRLLGGPLRIVSTDASYNGAEAIPLFDGVNYRVVAGGDTAMPLFVATVTDATFACRCLDDRVAVPLDFDLAKQGRYFYAAASRDAVVIGYEKWGDVSRVFLRFVRTPPPRRRATR